MSLSKDPVHDMILEEPVEPYPAERMKSKGGREICQMLYKAYELIDQGRTVEAQFELRLVVTLAKRMHKRFLETLVKLGELQDGVYK